VLPLLVSGIRCGVARKPYLKFFFRENPQKTLFISMKKKRKRKEIEKNKTNFFIAF
jgi:hypothetical protein